MHYTLSHTRSQGKSTYWKRDTSGKSGNDWVMWRGGSHWFIHKARYPSVAGNRYYELKTMGAPFMSTPSDWKVDHGTNAARSVGPGPRVEIFVEGT